MTIDRRVYTTPEAQRAALKCAYCDWHSPEIHFFPDSDNPTVPLYMHRTCFNKFMDAEDGSAEENRIVAKMIGYTKGLLASIDRFYVSQFGAYTIERGGVIAETYYGAREDEAIKYSVLVKAQQDQDVFKPRGIDEKYGWIFERQPLK